MQTKGIAGISLLALAIFVQGTPAEELPAACPASCPAACPDCSTRVNEVHLVERQDATTIPQLTVREVITRVPVMGVDVQYKEEKRCVTVMVLKSREIERQVSSISMVPETTVDPCTGKCCVTYKSVPLCKTVKETVFDTVPETREVIVKVPVIKPVERAVDVKTLTVDATSTAARVTRLELVEVPSVVTYPAPCPNIVLPPPACSTECPQK